MMERAGRRIRLDDILVHVLEETVRAESLYIEDGCKIVFGAGR